MKQLNTVECLTELTILLKSLNLYNKSDTITIGKLKLPNFVYCFLLASPFILAIYLSIMLCIENDFDLDVVTGASCLTIPCFQTLVVYTCVTNQRDAITESLDMLQNLVRQRESFFFIFNQKKIF